MKIEEMQAGREMDALVAEKVFHSKPCDKWKRLSTISMVKFDECEHGSCFPPMEGPPKYSTSISAAWEVVEKFDSFSIIHNAFYKKLGEEFIVCELTRYEPEAYAEGRADTAPLAICRAALSAGEKG